MTIIGVIRSCRNNRKVLLFIVYVALFLDNMLLTTVVPIIPEYLLRISHPNTTDYILYNKPIDNGDSRREKRETSDSEPILWDDNAWETPFNGREDRINWMESPLMPVEITPTSSNRRKGSKRTRRTRKPKVTSTTVTPQFSSSMESSMINNIKDITVGGLIEKQISDRHDTLTSENIQVGLMFGSKALIQLFTNPWVGPLTNKIGYTVPMFAGFCIMFTSTLMFAFGSSYWVLWLARALQGVGSACTSTSGMGMLAQAYPDDLERGSAMGIALGGLALGVLVGPPYGGLLYQWSGKELPFILLALLALFDGSLQFLILQPQVDQGEPEGTAIKELATDPYIIVAVGAITIGNLGIAMLEPSLPLWMMETWQAGSFERGAAFLPASISYLIGTNIFGPLAHKIGRWLSGCIGLVIIGFCLIMIPSAQSVVGLIVPNFFMGFSIGMIDASMFPLMGHLVDLRHVGVYGSIYAIADAAFCFAFALGPFFSGPLVRFLGFPTMMYLIAVINFAYAPLMFILRNPPATNKIKEAIVDYSNKNVNSTSDGKYESIGDKSSYVNTSTSEGYQYDF